MSRGWDGTSIPRSNVLEHLSGEDTAEVEESGSGRARGSRPYVPECRPLPLGSGLQLGPLRAQSKVECGANGERKRPREAGARSRQTCQESSLQAAELALRDPPPEAGVPLKNSEGLEGLP